MALIKEVRGFTPRLGQGCFLAENAVVVGDVVMGDRCSVWFHAVVRGDVNAVRIGHRVNIQDGAVLHCTYERAALTIGDDVSIGHRAIVHGCTVHDKVLIGMGAIVMDKAVVSTRVTIGAGSVVPSGKVLESGYLYVGSPVRQVRPLNPRELEFLEYSAENYQRLKERHRWMLRSATVTSDPIMPGLELPPATPKARIRRSANPKRG